MQEHVFHSPLRYPGGKGGLADFVKAVIEANSLCDGDYVEVFAGGAGIAWALLFEEYVRRVHINDLSIPVMAFWRAVVGETEALCRLVQDTPVTMEVWSRQRAVQARLSEHSDLELAFSTFFLNRTNRSGILTGGVIGGKAQVGKWQLDARFNRPDLIRRIQRIARYSARIRLYNQDATHFVATVLPALPIRCLVYLDPPYFRKGQELYENHYQPSDHESLAQLIGSRVAQPWLVSYDAVPEIVALYASYPRLDYAISYSAQARYRGAEVLFHSKGLLVPCAWNPAAAKAGRTRATRFGAGVLEAFEAAGPSNNSLQATAPAAFTSVSLRSPSVRPAGVAPELNAGRRPTDVLP